MQDDPSVSKATPTTATRSAFFLTSGYVVFCILYILISSHLAASIAHSVQQLEGFETTKGILFIVTSGLIFFFFARTVLRRIEIREQELVQSRDALLAAERRATAGVLASSIAHDLNNILTIVGAGVSELTESDAPSAMRLGAADQVQQAVHEMGALTRRLMSIGRDGLAADFAPGDLARTVHEAVQLALHHTKVRACQVTASAPPALEVVHSRRLVSQMILNLLINAAEATNGRGHLEVSLHARPAHIELRVSDDGPGISEPVRARLYEPFHTTKPNGTGLGLLSVKAAAEAHHGKLELVPSDLGGASFLITMPVALQPPARVARG